MKVYKIKAAIELDSGIEKEIKNLSIWFEEAKPGNVITIEVIEMSLQEYDNLSKHMGPWKEIQGDVCHIPFYMV